MVANQAQVFGQVIDFYLGDGKEHLPEINRLSKLNTPEADEVLLHYLMEGIRKCSFFPIFFSQLITQECMGLSVLIGPVKKILRSMMGQGSCTVNLGTWSLPAS